MRLNAILLIERNVLTIYSKTNEFESFSLQLGQSCVIGTVDYTFTKHGFKYFLENKRYDTRSRIYNKMKCLLATSESAIKNGLVHGIRVPKNEYEKILQLHKLGFSRLTLYNKPLRIESKKLDNGYYNRAISNGMVKENFINDYTKQSIISNYEFIITYNQLDNGSIHIEKIICGKFEKEREKEVSSKLDLALTKLFG